MNKRLLEIILHKDKSSYWATSKPHGLFLEAETLEELMDMVKDGVLCHLGSVEKHKDD